LRVQVGGHVLDVVGGFPGGQIGQHRQQDLHGVRFRQAHALLLLVGSPFGCTAPVAERMPGPFVIVTR
jgi:hypothetical protein